MLSDGVLLLDRSGSLDADRLINTSFLVGSPELYEWADNNPRLRMSRTETINDPSRISANPAMLSVNATLQIDLFAQANASFVDGLIYSGFGGQPDFVTGALHSSGGHAVVALRAWHDKSDASTVVPILTNPVTTSSTRRSSASTDPPASLGAPNMHKLGSSSSRLQIHGPARVFSKPQGNSVCAATLAKSPFACARHPNCRKLVTSQLNCLENRG